MKKEKFNNIEWIALGVCALTLLFSILTWNNTRFRPKTQPNHPKQHSGVR